LVRPDATGKISGRIVSSLTLPNGQPSIASLILVSTDPTALMDQGYVSVLNPVTNRTSGQFEVRGIVPGAYELMANALDSSGRQVWGRTRINVNPGELNDVTISIKPGVEVRARLTVDGAPPAYTMQSPPVVMPESDTSITRGITMTAASQTPATAIAMPAYRVQLRSAEGLAAPPPFENASNQDMTFDPFGLFVFRNVLEGRYTIMVTPLPPNGYIADVKAGGASGDPGIDINSQTGEIQVLVNTNGGRIEGVVLNAARKPFASARVALVPSESRRQNIQLYKTSLSDDSGRFNMNGIAPGDYKLFAWESLPGDAWTNAEFLAPFEGSGLAISVSPTSSTPARPELKLIPTNSDKW
jgi:hypothetical protein